MPSVASPLYPPPPNPAPANILPGAAATLGTATGTLAVGGAAVATATTGVLTVLGGMAAGAATSAVVSALLVVLLPLGISRRAALAAVRMVLSGTPPATYVSLPAGPATMDTLRQASFFQAAYLVHAALRIQDRLTAGQSPPEAVRHERAYFGSHRSAQRRRLQSARSVDSLALRGHRWLRWRLGEAHTHTPVCIAANGHPFRADQRPLPGWPGSTHPRCSCSAGPGVAPRAGELTVDDVTGPLIAMGLD